MAADFMVAGTFHVPSTIALVPKPQLGNAVHEALLRHRAFDTLHTALDRRPPASALRHVRTYKPAGSGFGGSGSGASRVCVPKLELGNEGQREPTRAELGNKFNALLSLHGHTRQV